MLKKTLIALTLALVSVLAIRAGNHTVRTSQGPSVAPSGTLQKMIV